MGACLKWEGKEDWPSGKRGGDGALGRWSPELQRLHSQLPTMGPTGLKAREGGAPARAVRVSEHKETGSG